MLGTSHTSLNTTHVLAPIACRAICATATRRKSEEHQMTRSGVITIRDVARESGYSASTVSIVLNNAPLSRYIPGDTKSRIEIAARRLGYRPNPLARSLRSQRSNIVGVMVFNITDPFCTPILRGIENALYQSNYLSLLADAHNEPLRFERYLEMLLDRRVEALIVVANWLVTDIKLLADLTERQVPTVIAGRAFATSLNPPVCASIPKESPSSPNLSILIPVSKRAIN